MTLTLWGNSADAADGPSVRVEGEGWCRNGWWAPWLKERPARGHRHFEEGREDLSPGAVCRDVGLGRLWGAAWGPAGFDESFADSMDLMRGKCRDAQRLKEFWLKGARSGRLWEHGSQKTTHSRVRTALVWLSHHKKSYFSLRVVQTFFFPSQALVHSLCLRLLFPRPIIRSGKLNPFPTRSSFCLSDCLPPSLDSQGRDASWALWVALICPVEPRLSSLWGRLAASSALHLQLLIPLYLGLHPSFKERSRISSGAESEGN